MESISEFIQSALSEGAYKFVLSGKRSFSRPYRRVSFSLLENEGEFFIEKLTDKQAFHSRIAVNEAADEIESCFSDFTQINAWSRISEYTAKLSKKGRLMTGRHKAAAAPKAQTDQNRSKNYLLPDNTVVPPLVDMGVMTPSGAVRKDMYDKFKQINRFLECIDDCIRDENLGDKEFNIIDFGCGKSYLTFIVYYYFSEIKHIPVRMTGLDLKEDVIAFCNGLAEKYGYDKLNFIAGDIAKYDMSEPVDMMISLHACDTATDYALYNAIVRGVRFILSVPCCQHELNTNADFGKMSVLNDSGILRERAASLFTDGIRAKMLTYCSYKTQLMEFVDLSHTPKNILIRAKKALIPESTRQKALMDAEELLEILNTEQTLHKLLIERKRK
ncbi:MAG: SAM-dependent methyltransferase [Clostridiales bacterium]|nr:SAM-dependent methyltransferase [Clostridiales bacterium]MDY5702380.1 SAM-dependent methyltransferase [Eubacteriales bacterium]